MLRTAHDHPGITRAAAAARLGLSSGAASDIMNRLRSARLLAETPGPATGTRGRPTTVLGPHPQGPLVAVIDISHDNVRVTTAEIGGALTPTLVRSHTGEDADTVVSAIARELVALRRQHGARLRAVSVSVTGTVHNGSLVQASTLRWRDVDLDRLASIGEHRLPLHVGNDATLAGVAEARRGAARGAGVALYLTVGVGVGGILLVDGVPAAGASGAAGEFGHMPFGDPDRRCPCGARGCWDIAVDGRAMARHLGRRAPADPRAFADRTVAAARAGDPTARQAVAGAASAFGRGIGALINGLDPGVVAVGDLGVSLLDVGSEPLHRALRDALMAWRRDRVPPIVPAAFGANAPALGAAETAFDALLAEASILEW
jgi:predicted NBD/HSP70 family sugar kinase